MKFIFDVNVNLRWVDCPPAQVLHRITLLEQQQMATQAQVDALVTRINTAIANIRQDIADVKAANPGIDLSALEASVGGIEGLDAENPGTPPTPPSAAPKK